MSGGPWRPRLSKHRWAHFYTWAGEPSSVGAEPTERNMMGFLEILFFNSFNFYMKTSIPCQHSLKLTMSLISGWWQTEFMEHTNVSLQIQRAGHLQIARLAGQSLGAPLCMPNTRKTLTLSTRCSHQTVRYNVFAWTDVNEACCMKCRVHLPKQIFLFCKTFQTVWLWLVIFIYLFLYFIFKTS